LPILQGQGNTELRQGIKGKQGKGKGDKRYRHCAYIRSTLIGFGYPSDLRNEGYTNEEGHPFSKPRCRADIASEC